MPRVKHMRAIALAVALVFLFSSVAFAAAPKYVYFQSGSNMVKVDYAKAVNDAMNNDNTLYNAVKQYVGAAEETGVPVIVETDDQKVLDYQKALGAGKRFNDIVNDPAYQATNPEAGKELRVENGQAIIGDIQPATVAITAIAATNGTITPTFGGAVPEGVTLADFSVTATLGGQAYTLQNLAFANNAFTFTAVPKAATAKDLVITVAAASTSTKVTGTASATVNIPANEAPAAPAVTADDTNNVIIGIDDTMEYSLDNGATWTKYDAANKPDLSGDKTVQVRVAATDIAPASEAVTLAFTKNLLTVSSVSAINATTVEVKLVNAPNAELTTTDKSEFVVKENGNDVAVSAVVKLASDLTGKTYRLTVASLANKEGTLNVNGKDGTFDFKAPVVTSIEANGDKTLVVSFNEKLDPATITTANFVVNKAGVPLGTNQAVPSADGTKVTLTLNTAMTVADYVLKLGTQGPPAVTVKDVAGNSIYAGTEVSFRPTADQLVNAQAPVITKAEYNNGDGTLKLTFDKDVLIANVDVTKFTLGGVAITAAATKVQTAANVVTITLAATTKDSVNAVAGSLSLVAVAEAFTDGAKATAGQTIDVSKVTPAVIQSASYSQETKVLTLNFDQAVKIADLSKIKVDDDAAPLDAATAAAATKPDGNALDLTKANTQWQLKLAPAQATSLEGKTSANLKVFMDAGAVTNDNAAATPNVATTYAAGAVAVTYGADTVKPYLTAAEYNDSTKVLTLTFSESLLSNSPANIAAMKNAGAVKFATKATGDANQIDLSSLDAATTFVLDASEKVYTITFGGADIGDETAKLFNQYQSKAAIKVFMAKDVVTDNNGLKNDAIDFANGITLTYKDYTPATVAAGPVALNNTHVQVVFSEKVTQATAEAAANYVIKDLTLAQLAVTKAELQADEKTVILTTAAQTAGAPYTIAISGVRDLSSLVMTNYSGNFTGSAATAAAPLKITALTAASVPNSNNDTLTVTFSEVPNQVQATSKANYVVLEAATNDAAGWTAATSVTISDATLKVNPANSKQVNITLGSYNLKDGKFYKVVASNITDVFGNDLDADNNNAISGPLNVAAPAAPAIYEYNTATNNIKLVFSEEMVVAEAQKAANYTIQGEVNPVLSASYSWDASAGKATVVLNLTNALTVPRSVTLNAAVTNLGLKPLAVLTVAAPASIVDGVAPTVDAVVAKTVPNAGNDVITITFKDKDILAASGGLSANYTVKDPAGSVISPTKYTVAFVDGGADVDKVTITFDKAGADAYNLQYNKSYTVTVSNVVDESGNVITTTTKTATWDPASDKVGPTVTGIAINAATKTFTVTYNEDADSGTASDKANYTIVYSANGTYSDAVTLTPIFANYNVGGKTADIIVSDTVVTSVGSKFKVIIKNVKDLAGNVSDGSLAGHSIEKSY